MLLNFSSYGVVKPFVRSFIHSFVRSFIHLYSDSGIGFYPVYFKRLTVKFYLTTHPTHFIYGYMASDIWLRTILIARGNPLPPHGLLITINSKGSFICTIPQTGLHIPRPLLHQSWSTGWNETILNNQLKTV